MKYLQSSFSVGMPQHVSDEDWKRAMCNHDWTDLYTDRDSPQSYVNGVYRGFRVVGRRCRRCGVADIKEEYRNERA